MNQIISSSLVTRLSEAGARIRRASEELEAVIGALEDFLVGLNLGFRTSVWIDTAEGPHRLVFGPAASGEWHLTIEKIRSTSGKKSDAAEVEASWRLGEASKSLMLAAAPELPALVDGLATRAAEEAERIESTVSALTGAAPVNIVDERTRNKLDREFLEFYAKRMNEEVARVSA